MRRINVHKSRSHPFLTRGISEWLQNDPRFYITSVNAASLDSLSWIRSAPIPGTKNMKNTCRMFARGFVIKRYSCILSVLSIISSTETNRSALFAFRWWLLESSTSDIWQKSRANRSNHRTCHWGTIVNIFLAYLHNSRKMKSRTRKIRDSKNVR